MGCKKKKKTLIIVFGILVSMFLLIGAFFLGRIYVENKPSGSKSNLPPDNPEPVPGYREEGRFDYEVFIKKGENIGYYVFSGIREDYNSQNQKIINISENHPEIKRLLRKGKLQTKKQFTIRYGKIDKEENFFWLTFDENNRELEIKEI